MAVSFALLFGFDEPYIPAPILYVTQVVLLCVFVAEKVVRFFNARLKSEYLHVFWFQIPLLAALILFLVGAGRWFAEDEPAVVRYAAVGIYLVTQVVIKVCRSVVNLAATGRNPTTTLILSFAVLIVTGAILLSLPKSTPPGAGSIGLVDALFTSTSATCVTGLIVKNTGTDFSLMGQVVILSLIQLGGLGIVVFGAVFALLLGQALTVRESVAMQDLLSARTLGRISTMIAFIFLGTIIFEIGGAVCLFGMWGNNANFTCDVHARWFYSIFHAISAFCNAGFSLFSDSFVGYSSCWQIYAVVCPLIILGGLGFSVLYDLFSIATEKIKRFFKWRLQPEARLTFQAPVQMRLQSKIVLVASAGLILAGALAIMLFEHYTGEGSSKSGGFGGALFQSITARTAGFNTVDVAKLSPVSRMILMLLMFVGGSPGSTAGGIKTVTFAVVIMTVVASLRKRSEVEMFRRSVRLVVIGRAVTVTVIFVLVLFTATFLLPITERANGFDM